MATRHSLDMEQDAAGESGEARKSKPLTIEPFADRVWLLHTSWHEHRLMKELASSGEFEPQFEMLMVLFGWAQEDAAAIAEVLEGQANVLLSEQPSRDEAAPSFRVVIGGGFSLAITLVEYLQRGRQHWRIQAMVGQPGNAPTLLARRRQAGNWTRRGFEDALLTVLSAYERSVDSQRSRVNPGPTYPWYGEPRFDLEADG